MRQLILAALAVAAAATAQDLSPKWDELTAGDFVKAIEKAKGTCILPMGILEKHGPAGPIGTDLFDARFAVLNAVKEEYAVVFPEYFVGQIFEAQHQPGTVAYSSHLQMEFLQETTSEMARNGCTKIVLYSGHGGNNGLVSYFTMTQLEKPKDWVLYTIGLGGGAPGATPSAAAAPSKPGVDGHAGESEISAVMAARPELVHTERSGTQSGKNLARLDLPAGVGTSISWYSMYPNHYQGDSAAANAVRGQALAQTTARIVAALRAIKADQAAPRLQKEFFEKTTKPLQTSQQ
jgi:creatinine amidohydrolase